MADDKKKQLAFAIAEFLSEELNTLSEDAKESLEVAIQCLESSYGFEMGDGEAQALYSLKPRSLLEVFETGLAAPTMPSNLPSYGEVDDARQRADAMKDQGNEAVKSGDYQGAIKMYSEAISICPDNAIYYVNRAAAYTKLDQLDKAIADCQKGVEINPLYSKGFSRMGTCYFAQQNWVEAVKAYEQAALLEPTNQSYKDNLAAAKAKAGNGKDMSATGQAPAGPSANDLAGLLGGMGGGAGGAGAAGGMPDLNALLSNPAMMDMAQKFMQSGGLEKMMENPAMMQMAANMMGNRGGQGGASPQAPNLQEMLNNPDLQK
eukprot:Ihof_evm1s14 gene=Ihof_evmTU1s14